ncbi:cell division protein ZapA [Psychrobacter sp.]|uniref:cell division protein ZapA n=1 Tax=Psychrobacter sp. TaxID=56811 RepID=UPI002647CAFC|nr:cell division protein ZapA [Psychrobacter sp.]MDN6276285.1 cell division protein ZapA [Psychrobacter sp.]MDN6307830.1 cell division protein ZapA [Psychrobacter sp.]
MTDNQIEYPNQQPANGQTQTNALADSNPLNNTTKPGSKNKNTPEPQIKKVDIAIAGVTYPIYCPVDEQEDLQSAVTYINNYALELRRDAPSLSQESILVLCCLNLYERISANQQKDAERTKQDQQTRVLLNKITKDAHSIL